MTINWNKPCVCTGLTTEHEFGAPGCALGSDGYDRTHPKYRLFNLSDQEDGRNGVWFTILADNFLGPEVTSLQAETLFKLVGNSEWGPGFWRAYERNSKATIYASMLPPNFSL